MPPSLFSSEVVKTKAVEFHIAVCTFCGAGPDCDGYEYGATPQEAVSMAIDSAEWQEHGDELLCENCWTARDPSLADEGDPVGWSLVHRAHVARKPLRVTFADGRIFEGTIHRLDNHGFSMSVNGLSTLISWPLVKAVEVVTGGR